MQLNDHLSEDFTLNDRKLRKARELKRRAKEGSLLEELHALNKQRGGTPCFKINKRFQIEMGGSIREGIKYYLKSLFFPTLTVFLITFIAGVIIVALSPPSGGGFLSITDEAAIILFTLIIGFPGSGAAITLTSLFFVVRLLKKGRGKSASALATLFLLTAIPILIFIVLLQH